MSKLTVLEEHLASMQMNYNAKHLGMQTAEGMSSLENIKELRKTIETLKMPNGNVDTSNIKVHFEEVKPDSKSILTKLFKSFKN